MTNEINKCALCNSNTERPKYCSKRCIRRAWHLRNSKVNHYEDGGDFWKSQTGIGLMWEEWVAQKLGARHLKFNNKGCDLEYNGKKIDVKVSNLWKRKNKRGAPVKGEQSGVWVFNRNKPKECDSFICICLIDNKVEKILMIPSSQFPKSGAVVGRKSKYDKYATSL